LFAHKLVIDTGSSQKLLSLKSIMPDWVLATTKSIPTNFILKSCYFHQGLRYNIQLFCLQITAYVVCGSVRLWPILGTQLMSRSSSRSVRNYTSDIRNAIHVTLEILRDAIMRLQGRSWPGILAIYTIHYSLLFPGLCLQWVCFVKLDCKKKVTLTLYVYAFQNCFLQWKGEKTYCEARKIRNTIKSFYTY